MKQFTDQLGTTHTFENTPKRIVSLVPSQTELLFDLGLEENIIGITKFCVHPTHLRSEKAMVGGTKNIKFDKIKALQPDIIICNKEENTKEIVAQLSQICPVWVTNIVSVEDNLQMITDFGNILTILFQINHKLKQPILFGKIHTWLQGMLLLLMNCCN